MARILRSRNLRQRKLRICGVCFGPAAGEDAKRPRGGFAHDPIQAQAHGNGEGRAEEEVDTVVCVSLQRKRMKHDVMRELVDDQDRVGGKDEEAASGQQGSVLHELLPVSRRGAQEDGHDTG